MCLFFRKRGTKSGGKSRSKTGILLSVMVSSGPAKPRLWAVSLTCHKTTSLAKGGWHTGTPCTVRPLKRGAEDDREGGGAAGRGVPARRGGRGSFLRPVTGKEVWEYHEPGSPHEPGPLASSQPSGKKKHISI